MTLNEYIEKVKLESGITYDTTKIHEYVKEKARTYLDGVSGAVDDETVHGWILEYKPTEDKKPTKEEIKKSEPPVKLAGQTKEVKGEWGTQESLF